MICITLAIIYMIPTILAADKKHRNVEAIACCNILLGWTFIGWCVALIWAVSEGPLDTDGKSKKEVV